MTDSTPRCAAGDRTISHPAFAALYDRFMPDRFLIGPPPRKYLAADLSGRVLDIGAGNGVMIPYGGRRRRRPRVPRDRTGSAHATPGAREARGTSQRFTSAETTPSHYRTPTTASTSSSRVWSLYHRRPETALEEVARPADRAANCASSSTSVTTAGGLERRTPSRRCGNALRAAVS